MNIPFESSATEKNPKDGNLDNGQKYSKHSQGRKPLVGERRENNSPPYKTIKSHSKQMIPSKPHPKIRHSRRMQTSADPMIQSISGAISKSSLDIPEYLSLSLTDATNSSLDLSDSPKLHRRRSRNKLVEAIVSKAVEDLAQGHKKSPTRDSPSSLHRKLSPKLQPSSFNTIAFPSNLSATESDRLKLPLGESKTKNTKLVMKRKIRKRCSDTGVLGQIGYLSPSQGDGNKNVQLGSSYHQSPSFLPSTDDEEKGDSSVAAVYHTPKRKDAYFTSPSTLSGQDSSGYMNSTDNEDYENDDLSDSPIFEKIDDSSYDESNITESSSDEYSVKVVPEQLWNGSVLLPNGQLTTAEAMHSFDGSSGYDIEEQESVETDYEVSIHSLAKSSSESLISEEYDNINERQKDTSNISYQYLSSPRSENEGNLNVSKDELTSTNINESVDEVVAEIVDIDDLSSSYSTDTDHESGGDEIQHELQSSRIPSSSITTASIISPLTSHRSKPKSNGPEESYHSEKNEKLVLPRFKLHPLSSPGLKSRSTVNTAPLSTISSSSTSVVTTISRHEYVKPNKWSLGSQIGAGSFGVVHVGMNDLTGNLMAVKVLKNILPESSQKHDSDMMKDLQREIDLMRKLSHPNIVRYFGAERKKNSLYIFQEWVPGGSVSSLLRKFGSFTVSVVRRYLYQILQGLHYLHSNRILHRDIKGGNILVDDKGTIKLADFGASKEIFPQSLGESNSIMMQSMTIKGTPYFMAPEVFEQKYNKKADIWSVGGVILQMITGQPPWKTLGFQSPMSLFYHLKSTDGPPPVDIDLQSPSLTRIVESCFERDADKRPGAHEILEDVFFVENEEDDEDDCIESSYQNEESYDGIDSLEANNLVKIGGKTHPKHQDRNYSNAMRNITNVEKKNKGDRKMTSGKGKPSPSILSTDIIGVHSDNKNLSKDSGDWPVWAKERESKKSSITKGLIESNQAKKPNPFRRQKSNGNIDSVLPSMSKLTIDNNIN